MTYLWTCNACDAQFDCPDLTAASLPVCERCESSDIEEPVVPNREFDDEADAQRLAEIRERNAPRYAAMDVLATLDELNRQSLRASQLSAERAATLNHALDVLVDMARGRYDVPVYSESFLQKRQAG